MQQQDYLIRNAQVITPTGVIQKGTVRVEGREIVYVGPEAGSETGVTVIDAAGSIVMPGIIDIHTDAMDAEIVPRPGADIPIPVAFRELERKMCTCGFTTVFHSLHLGYVNAEKHSRSRFARKDIFEGVAAEAARPTLIRNKIHLRFEVTGVDALEYCKELLRSGTIQLLSVMDHTPGQGQTTREQFMAILERQGKSKAEADQYLDEMSTRPKVVGEDLETLVGLAVDLSIPVASHDDDTPAKVDEMRAMGVRVCEFPINPETARYASKAGQHVAGGASNVLRGGSLSGNMDMTSAIIEGSVDVLCSDYYPASILHSIFKLHQQNAMPLHQAVNLGTLNPARAVGMGEVIGSLEAGKDADLLLVRLVDGIPMVTHSMVGGKLVLQTEFR